MRVKIEFLTPFVFQVDIPVRISDINYGGHVGNDAILSLVHEARIAFFSNWKMTEMNAGGVSIIMADAAVQYRAEAFYGDIIKVEICVGEISSIAFELYYKLSTNRNDNIMDIAFVKTGLICYDYESRKKMKITNELLAALTS
jgi:acyl-CoA thioester hydrolase